jgi:cobalt-zinc-cadmium efflux system protein
LNPVQPDTKGMIVLALLGIVFNGLAAIKLRKGNSLNQQMVSWHLYEDVLGWTGVLIISVVMRFYDLPELDGIFSVLFTLFILYNVIKVLRKTLKIFLQGIPENMNPEKLTEDLHNIPNIISSHDIRIWSMDGEQTVMTLHVVVPENICKPEIIKVKNLVQLTAQDHGINHVTIEIEYESETCDLEPV